MTSTLASSWGQHDYPHSCAFRGDTQPIEPVQMQQQQQQAPLSAPPVYSAHSGTMSQSPESLHYQSADEITPLKIAVMTLPSASESPQPRIRLACTCPNTGTNGDDTLRKKQHFCHFPYCDKVYSKASQLRIHLRLHTGERPYICNWFCCGKCFTRSDELKRHMRIHTKERPFGCSKCQKHFMRSDHLKKHQKIHDRAIPPLIK